MNVNTSMPTSNKSAVVSNASIFSNGESAPHECDKLSCPDTIQSARGPHARTGCSGFALRTTSRRRRNDSVKIPICDGVRRTSNV